MASYDEHKFYRKLVSSQVLAGRADLALASEIEKFWGENAYLTHPVDIFLVESSPQQLRQYMNLFYTFDKMSWLGILFCYFLTSVVMCVGWFALQANADMKVVHHN